MANMRMRIAAGATVLGLGGLGGYALGSNPGRLPPVPAVATDVHQKPKVHTHVVHRTIHVRPKPGAASAAAVSPPASASPTVTPAPAALPPTPAPATTPVSAPSSQPVSTHSSGAGSGAGGDDGGSDHENESEGGGDD